MSSFWKGFEEALKSHSFLAAVSASSLQMGFMSMLDGHIVTGGLGALFGFGALAFCLFDEVNNG